MVFLTIWMPEGTTTRPPNLTLVSAQDRRMWPIYWRD